MMDEQRWPDTDYCNQCSYEMDSGGLRLCDCGRWYCPVCIKSHDCEQADTALLEFLLGYDNRGRH